MSTPRISILCPVLNVAKYIRETLDSVQAQSFQDWELIVMDGVSKDGTVEILHEYAAHDPRIRVYSEPDECAQHAFDKTLDLARGEFLCNICGQDGFLDRDWLAKCIEVFDRERDVSLVWALGEVKKEDGTMLPGQYDTYYAHFMGGGGAGVASAVFAKGLKVVRDLVWGGRARRKVLWDNLFSRHAKLKMNILAKRRFEGGPPQKEDWFLYWLNTGLTFLDLSMVISTRVFLECTPRYRRGDKVIEYMSDFFYHFNSRGYLAYFIPTHAVFTRLHPGNSSARAGAEMHRKMQEYLNKVMSLREKVLGQGESVSFRDRSGKVIANKTVRNGTWV